MENASFGDIIDYSTMNNTLSIRIAEIPVRLEFDGADAIRNKIFDHYAAFAIPADAENAVSIRVHEQPGDEYIPLNSSPEWQIHTHASNGRIEFESYHEKGWADRVTGQGELTLRPQADLENFLRVLYAWLCLDQSGLLLHASGIISEKKGYVFFGPSGSGKTTIARLSLDRIVLSDDLVAIRKRGDKFWVYGVPFRGDFPEASRTNADAELSGIFALVKDSQHCLKPLPLPEAIARLAACVPFVMTQTANSARVLETCSALAASVPVRALHFRQDVGFWELVRGRE